MKMILENQTTFKYNMKKPDGKKLHTNIILIGKIINKMKNGFSPIVLIVGGQRMGKSFVGVWLSFRILNFFNPDVDYDPKKYTYYDPLRTIGELNQFKKEPLLIDEAGAVVNKTEWYNKVTIALDKIIQTQGYLCNSYIFISPFGSDIAKTFRKHFDYIIYVRKRGVAVVKEVPKKYDDMTDNSPKPYWLEQIKLSKNSVPKQIWNKYEKFSFEQKEEIRKNAYIDTMEKTKKRHKNRWWLND